jgi:hypothetical protein
LIYAAWGFGFGEFGEGGLGGVTEGGEAVEALVDEDEVVVG